MDPKVCGSSESRFPSSPLIIRVPFFLLFGFNKGTQKEKGQKGTTGEPRSACCDQRPGTARSFRFRASRDFAVLGRAVANYGV